MRLSMRHFYVWQLYAVFGILFKQKNFTGRLMSQAVLILDENKAGTFKLNYLVISKMIMWIFCIL